MQIISVQYFVQKKENIWFDNLFLPRILMKFICKDRRWIHITNHSMNKKRKSIICIEIITDFVCKVRLQIYINLYFKWKK